jgi:hypothetical protein
MYKNMKARGVAVDYYVYEGEGHNIASPFNVLDCHSRAEQFLKQHLGGRSDHPRFMNMFGSSVTSIQAQEAPAAAGAIDQAHRGLLMSLRGIPEGGVNVPGLMATVKSLFGPPTSRVSQSIVAVRRNGRPPAEGWPPRAVLVTFSNPRCKLEAFEQAARLRIEHAITLDDFLDQAQRDNRERLAPKFKDLRKRGLRPEWWQDRIMVTTAHGLAPYVE